MRRPERQLATREQTIVSIQIDRGQVITTEVAAERFINGWWEDASEESGSTNRRRMVEIRWQEIKSWPEDRQHNFHASISTLAMMGLRNDRVTSLNVHPGILGLFSFQKQLEVGLQVEKDAKMALEIIETGPALTSVPGAIDFLHMIKERFGVKIWIDDVDTPGGVNTMAWVREQFDQHLVCLDAIKLERRELANVQIREALLWVRDAGRMAIIEQVEDRAQLEELLDMVAVCRLGLNQVLWQGHLWGGPEPVPRG